MFAEDTNILINGRLYPQQDGSMYVVPTQPLIGVNNSVKLNQLTLAGGVGFIGEQKREDAFNFGLMCQAPPQKVLVTLGKIAWVSVLKVGVMMQKE